jgi:hypothetical protein
MTQQEIQQQEIQALLQVYQRRVSDLMAQSIAFEARLSVQEAIINSLQQQLETTQATTKSPNRKVNTIKTDEGEF